MQNITIEELRALVTLSTALVLESKETFADGCSATMLGRAIVISAGKLDATQPEILAAHAFMHIGEKSAGDRQFLEILLHSAANF